MATKHLAVYLNDHLAGSVAALDLLQNLETMAEDGAFAAAIGQVRMDIAADQQELEGLMARLQIDKSATRQVVAWLGEKAGRLKLQVDDAADGALRRFEALEMVALGVQGKRALWAALLAAGVPGMAAGEYERLVQRTEDQHRRVEALRLQAATEALAS